MERYTAKITVGALSHASDHALDSLVGKLSLGGSGNLEYRDQIAAWKQELIILREVARGLVDRNARAASWTVIFEYKIPRRPRRPDVVILSEKVVHVLEFKVGATAFRSQDLWQARDYALDLRDFHTGSATTEVLPYLVASEATGAPRSKLVDGVHVRCVHGEALAKELLAAEDNAPSRRSPLNAEQWVEAGYQPVPTIVEAADSLYHSHNVDEIKHNFADNLTVTVDELKEIIQDAEAQRERVVCFVTGVPGAGKTLTGLAAIHESSMRKNGKPTGVFLSGNSPLVAVIRESISRGAEGVKRREAKRTVQTFVQNVHRFIDEYADTLRIPPEHVIVFDEAQRAWSADHMERKKRGSESEPALLLDIMARCPDWSVVVALIGGGQEINKGEAGLESWGLALESRRTAKWKVYAPREAIEGQTAVAGHRVFQGSPPDHIELITRPALHLSVSVRSPRALTYASWVEAVLGGRAGEARHLMEQIPEFPVHVTRSFQLARRWLDQRSVVGGRAGFVSSSSNRRLRAYGLQLSTRQGQNSDIENWFLADRSDVRSSYALEVAATEFECQGLELDWVGVCWGDDVTRRLDGTWELREWWGSDWRRPNDEKARYLVNAYRVLLTRARQGLIIVVPPGSYRDPTRNPASLDQTYAFLVACGAQPIEEGVTEALLSEQPIRDDAW